MLLGVEAGVHMQARVCVCVCTRRGMNINTDLGRGRRQRCKIERQRGRRQRAKEGELTSGKTTEVFASPSTLSSQHIPIQHRRQLHPRSPSS